MATIPSTQTSLAIFNSIQASTGPFSTAAVSLLPTNYNTPNLSIGTNTATANAPITYNMSNLSVTGNNPAGKIGNITAAEYTTPIIPPSVAPNITNIQTAKNTSGVVKRGTSGSPAETIYPEYTRSKNRLDDYREYTYHTIFFMASDAAAAAYIDTYFKTQADITGLSGKRTIVSTPGGGYFVPITDSLNMTDIYITYFDIDSFVETTVGSNAVTMMGTSATLKMMEPRGCYLLDIMSQLSNQIGVTLATSAYYVMKIFIVGFTNTNTVEYITDIPVISMLMTSLALDFNENGTQYHWQLVPRTGLHEASTPYANSVANGLHINTTINGKAGTVSEVMSKLQAKLNSISTQYYSCMTGALNKQGCTAKYAEINYKINVDPHYAKFLIKQANLNNKDSGVCNEGPIINASDSTSVAEIIGSIIHCCPEILALKSNFPAILITHDMISSGSHPTYDITYSIVNSKTPGSIKIPNPPVPVNQSTPTSVSGGTQTITPNFVFDYDYTGDNVDVLKYQMALDASAAFFSIIPTNTTNNVSTNGNGPTTVVGVKANPQFVCPTSNSVIPLFPGSMSPMKYHTHFPDPANAMAYNMRMSTFVSMSQTTAQLIIRGNPDFLSASNEVFGVNFSTNAGSMLTVQVNVKIPNYKLNNLGNDVAAEKSSLPYAKRFWYQGVYMVKSVKSIFTNGEFTQQLDLNVLPQNLQQSLGNQTTTTDNIGTIESTCVGSNPANGGGCGGGSGVSGASLMNIQPGTPTPSQAAFKNKTMQVLKNSPEAAALIKQGMNTNDMIAQQALETGNGTSYQYVHNNNPGGLSGTPQTVAHLNSMGIPCQLAQSHQSGNGTYIAFPTLQDGTNAMYSSEYLGSNRYQSTLKQNGYYNAGVTPSQQAAIYGTSMHQAGYATDPNYAEKIAATSMTYAKIG
jgi:hypothetical protein